MNDPVTKNLFEIAISAYENKDFKRAFSSLNKFNRTNTGLDFQQIILDVHIHIKLEKFEKALTLLSKAQQLNLTSDQEVFIHNEFVNIYRHLALLDKWFHHLEKSCELDNSWTNAHALLELTNEYVSTSHMTKAKDIAQRLLNWDEYNIQALIILINIAIYNDDNGSIIKFSQSLSNRVTYLSQEQVFIICQQLVDTELYEQAKLLIVRDIQSKGLLPHHKICQATIELGFGNLKNALNIFKGPECEHIPYSLYFYHKLQEYYFQRDQGERFFAHESEFKNDYFLLTYTDKYVSCGELGQLITKTDSFTNDNHIYTTRLDSDRIIAFFLLGDIKSCKKLLNKYEARTSSLFEVKELKVSLIFNKVIDSLIRHNKKHKNLLCCDKTELLYVIGESHCLTLSNKIFNCLGSKYLATSNFIKGLQMHHLNDEVQNEYKYFLAKHIEKTPENANLLFTIGEIDCRINIGISRVSSKLKCSIDEVISITVTKYINYLAKKLQNKKVKTVFIQGIPAPFIKKLVSINNDEHIQLIQKVNSKIQELTLAKNWIFIDVYAATKDVSGWSHGNWHIDPIHLKPSLYDEISKWTITNS